MVEDSAIRPALGPVPDGVEVSRRAGDGKEVYIVVNYTTQAQTINLPRPMRELLKDSAASSVLTLSARDVAVLAPAAK
jgi:beta-galactosidase